MEKKESLLKVPGDVQTRQKMRDEAKMLISRENILPPVSMETLQDFAGELINKLDISDKYLDFAKVLIGNETWRTTVQTIPFNRRILLLPQCLKHNAECKGTLDEMGLSCAGCKRCLIDDILDEAENLGYTTLVAEGTPIILKLVEEGSIDAVIGVSCMEALQESFDPVSRAAIPVLGIPLLFDGCVNTEIDLNWLLDEIRLNGQNDNIPLSVPLLKNKVNDYFTDKKLEEHFTGTNDVDKYAREMMSVGGQRMRPLMSVLSYLAYSNKEKENIVASIAMIIECFHKASLIHDDIQDNAGQRYNTGTLHKKHGVPVAINVGDYLIGKGYQILAKLPIKKETIAKCLQMVSLSHINITQGQGADITIVQQNQLFTTEQAIEIFKLKTGEAIKVALLLGAIVGEANENDIRILEIFADVFGIAYQVRDDLNEFYECDVQEKISDYPILMALLYENNQGLNVLSNLNVKEFRAEIEKLNLLPKAEDILQIYINNCYAELDKLKNLRLRLSLYGVMGKVFKTTNSDGKKES